MNLEDFIKDLEPELQEEARACGSFEELLALAKDAKIPLPDEALAVIAGGDDSEVGYCVNPKCPRCGSRNTEEIDGAVEGKSGIVFDPARYRCKDCGYKWTIG